ncbi:Essential protein Yae1 N-terminal [Penicillium chermesinum]|nr:Essential protein Yae1 N-terminal [Penicillium chermesinum]
MYGGTPIAPPIHLNFFLIAPIPPHHLQSKNLRSNVTTSKVLPTPGSKYPAKKGHDTNAHRLQFRELRPSIPATTMSADSNTTHPAANSLDDIFGSSPETSSTLLPPAAERAPAPGTGGEPSDLPSLRRQHVTAGYRDGLSKSKGQHVQAGFDGGFPVGAQLGMRAGTVLGILEGISRGLEERGGGVAKKPGARSAGPSTAAPEEGRRIEARARVRAQVRKIYEDAVKALDVQAVFAGSGGPTVGMQLGPDRHQEAGERKEEGAEEALRRKGDAAITGWEEKVAVPRWEEIWRHWSSRRLRGRAREMRARVTEVELIKGALRVLVNGSIFAEARTIYFLGLGPPTPPVPHQRGFDLAREPFFWLPRVGSEISVFVCFPAGNRGS